MPSEAEVKIWIEHANEYSRKFDGFNPPWLVGLKSLASSWLGRKMAEKMEIESFSQQKADGSFECSANQQYVNGWNAAIDACRLASVVSEEKVEKILEEHITHILHYHDKEGGRTSKAEIIFKQRFGEVSHAIAEYVNGGGK